jgi:hypothetical protein
MIVIYWHDSCRGFWHSYFNDIFGIAIAKKAIKGTWHEFCILDKKNRPPIKEV